MGVFRWCAAAILGATAVAVTGPIDAQTAYVPINRRGAPMASDSPRECIGSSLPDLKSRAAQVFEATVTSVKPLEHHEVVATLDVHRIWKGDASRATTVYFVLELDGPVIEDGKRYIFFTEPLNPDARKVFGLPEDHPRRADWVPPCTGPRPPDESTVKQLGPSRTPK